MKSGGDLYLSFVGKNDKIEFWANPQLGSQHHLLAPVFRGFIVLRKFPRIKGPLWKNQERRHRDNVRKFEPDWLTSRAHLHLQFGLTKSWKLVSSPSRGKKIFKKAHRDFISSWWRKPNLMNEYEKWVLSKNPPLKKIRAEKTTKRLWGGGNYFRLANQRFELSRSRPLKT